MSAVYLSFISWIKKLDFLQKLVLSISLTENNLFFAEGGRLEKELRYTKAALGEDASSTTHQLLIQTPRTPEASVLQPSSLLAHLDVVRAASAVSVHMFDMLVISPCYS